MPPEKLCASKATYDLIKRELFRRAAQLRGSDQAAYDRLSAYAVLRMENPVMESQDSATGAVNCSGSLSLDLPPGVAVVGGRRTLTSDVDYTVQPAADGSGNVVLLRNADAIVTPLATLARTAQPAPSATLPPEANEAAPEPMGAQPPVPSNPAAPAEPSVPAQPSPSSGTHPSFDCAKARTKSEIAVCSHSRPGRPRSQHGDRNIAAPSPERRRRSGRCCSRTRDRFLAYRDRCPNRACIGDAYVGRMREIRDIMEGRWQPPR